MPSLKNLTTYPAARVLSDDGETAVVAVSGMLCEWG